MRTSSICEVAHQGFERGLGLVPDMNRSISWPSDYFPILPGATGVSTSQTSFVSPYPPSARTFQTFVRPLLIRPVTLSHEEAARG
jgi:hypothetical protein